MNEDVIGKSDLICAHFGRMHENLDSAELLFAAGHISKATSCLYYAVFHAVHALFVSNDITAKTHHGMNAQFHLHFIKTGLFDTKFGRLVAVMENMREKAEYDVVFRITSDEYSELKPIAYELIQKIEETIK